MRRKDDISELSYALILLGAGQPSDFGNSDIEQVGDTIDSFVKPSWDYPFFPIGGKGLSVVQKHYMQGGWFARAVRQSLVSEQPIYPLVVDSDIFLKYTK